MTTKHTNISALRGCITALAGSLLAGVLLALSLTPAMAQGGDLKVIAKHGSWDVNCGTPPGSKKEKCAIIQVVTSENKPNAGLVLTILRRVNGQKWMRIAAPLGVLLPPGLLIKVDQVDFGRAPYVKCDKRGCLSEFELKDDLLKKLLAGKEALFIFWDTPEEGIVFPISLKGLKPALAKLK